MNRPVFSITFESRHYFPRFLWKFFLSSAGSRRVGSRRMHMYDVHVDTLVETWRFPRSKNIFCHFESDNLEPECRSALDHAEEAFARLESQAELALMSILKKLASSGEVPKRETIALDHCWSNTLCKYFIFLRYRNSDSYHENVSSLGWKAAKSHPWIRYIPYGPLRRRAALGSLQAFLEYDSEDDLPAQAGFFEDINEHLWRPYRETLTELSIGIASDHQEFILTDRWFGNLDEVDSYGSSDGSYHLFFPITPTVTVYLITTPPRIRQAKLPTDVPIDRTDNPSILDRFTAKRKREDDSDDLTSHVAGDTLTVANKKARNESYVDDKSCQDTAQPEPVYDFTVMIDHSCSNSTTVSPTQTVVAENDKALAGPPTTIVAEVETVHDVHMRNRLLLRAEPRYILFASLLSMVNALLSYDPMRDDPLQMDLNALKLHCRQKHIRESLVKTLVVRDDVSVPDLTDEVVRLGQSEICHGSYANIWQGEWIEQTSSTRKMVALKVLRQYVVDEAKDKLLKRLKDEVFTWHRLRHPHIAQLHGIIQLPHTLAMVSSWCKNGTIMEYLKKVNPSADKLKLLNQIASGVSYLHNYNPIVIHGDLKGNNILIDDSGAAVITDFGVSKVLEDPNDSNYRTASLLSGGAARWLAPELIVEEGPSPLPTTQSDVYAFAAVCLEIVTGKIPYPTYTEHGVLFAKMRGTKPSRSDDSHLPGCAQEDTFWALLDQCWSSEPDTRPSMLEMTAVFGTLANPS